MTFIFRALLLLAFLPSVAFSGHLNLPKDTSGWTIFTPSSDSRIMYVSSAGNDSTGTVYTTSNHPSWATPFTPSGPVNAFSTYAAAVAHARHGAPDWILMKRGDVFYEAISIQVRNGRSVTEPFLISSYGDSGVSPILKVAPSALAGIKISYKSFVAVSGLDFYAYTRDPNGGEYTGTAGTHGLYLSGSADLAMQAVLIEGCKFRFFGYNAIDGYANTFGTTVRRCLFLDTYSSGGHSQGLAANWVGDTLVLEENIFDHNGWLFQDDKDGVFDIGEATLFNQNVYLGGNVGLLFTNNIVSRASSIGVKMATYADDPKLLSGSIENNLIVDGEVGISIWGEYAYPRHYNNLNVKGNVLTNIGRSKPTDRAFAWMIDVTDVSTGSVSENIIMNQVDSTIWGRVFNTRGYVENVQIVNNVLHNLLNVDALQPSYDAANPNNLSNVTFANNKINMETSGGYLVNALYDPSTSWTFSGNKYYTSKADGARFRVVSVNKTDAQWISLTGDNSTFAQPTFPDPTRSIETYMASLGETATIDAFIAKARAQDRYNWDARYTADAVNDYIRDGFGMSEYTPPGQARRLFRNVRLADPVE